MRNTFSLPMLMPVLAAAWLGVIGPAAAEPNVVASIKPIHSLAAGVMEGVGTPTLLVEGAGSAHGYAMRPSDARALARADVVFWVGEGLETYMVGPLAELAGNARVVALAEARGVALLPLREGIAWEAHDHEHHGEAADKDHHDADGHHGEAHDNTDHRRAGYDAHIWLDPDNARWIVAAMAETLSEVDPENAEVYRANADRLAGRIAILDRELAARLAPVDDIPYVVFHDAYQYFEDHYDLAAVGSITLSPELAPGAHRLREIREKIVTLRARCVSSEPQFEPALVETVRKGTAARTGVLDPLGGALEDGPDLYFELMRSLAGSLRACLSESS